jgi:hypothetical protein
MPNGRGSSVECVMSAMEPKTLSSTEVARHCLREAHGYVAAGDAASAWRCLAQAIHGLYGPEAGPANLRQLKESLVERVHSLNQLDTLISRLSIASTSKCQGDEAMQVDCSATPSSRSSVSQVPEQYDSRVTLVQERYANMTDEETYSLHDAQRSSFQCNKCGGIVALERRRQHAVFWCPAMISENTLREDAFEDYEME